jgi:aminoglycoside phosphotransferase (APT) family kinase protein
MAEHDVIRWRETLRLLDVAPERVVAADPLPGGLSGGELARLTLAERTVGEARWYARRVLKHVRPCAGWLGAASADTLAREARLWSSGVLADLPASLATGVLASAQDAGDGSGALLMRDLRGRLAREPLRTPPGQLPASVQRLLDALARLHARYWRDPRLADPALGLMPARAALLLTSPEGVARRIVSGDDTPYLRLAAAGWEAFFRLATVEDAATLRAALADPAPYVAAIEALPWTLVHGDVWGPNLGFLPATHVAPRVGPRVLLLDWALATAGPATYDPLWLCGTWHALDPVRVLAAYRARLTRHLAARGSVLAPATWRALADAGYLRTALTCGEALARTAAEADSSTARRRAEARVRWWARRAAAAARRLSA